MINDVLSIIFGCVLIWFELSIIYMIVKAIQEAISNNKDD